MSGGSWGYAYRQVESIAERLLGSTSIRRRALGQHLTLVAYALKSIEWVDSSDWEPEDERAAIMQVLTPAQVASAVAASLHDLRAELAEIEHDIARPDWPAAVARQTVGVSNPAGSE